ncbi:MAG: hypothetical protein AAGA48_08715 [Myxococcota bacterium]
MLLLIAAGLSTALAQVQDPRDDPDFGDSLPPECPTERVFDCENLRPAGGPVCTQFVTTRTYTPDALGNCILTNIEQFTASPADLSVEDCPTDRPPQETPVAGDEDICPDITTSTWDVMSPDTFCCGTCSVMAFEPQARQILVGPNAGEWFCVPIDADPSTPGLDPVTRGEFCFPGDCTPGSADAAELGVDKIGKIIIDPAFGKTKFNLWWGYLGPEFDIE